MAAGRLVVWAGGAMFVLSLAYCAWWYLVPAGREAAFAGAGALAWDTALMALFACHHSVFAREAVKRRLQRAFGPLARSVFVWTASVLLIIVCRDWSPIGGEVYRAAGAARLALASLQVAGVILIARSVAAIDPLELAGIHAAGAPDSLQTGGPYGLVRHPLYLGWMIAAFATPHLTGDRLAFAVLTSLYLVVAVPWEERSLRAAFGPAYARYTDEVRWRVIPFIY